MKPFSASLLTRIQVWLPTFSDTAWVFRLGYSADIFGELNRGNLAFQEKQTTILDACESVSVPVYMHHRANVGFSAAGLGESWQNCQHLTSNANFLLMIYF